MTEAVFFGWMELQDKLRLVCIWYPRIALRTASA
jgi:hypothetical protein